MIPSSFVWIGYQRVTDEQTELPWLLQRSALQVMRLRCRNQPRNARVIAENKVALFYLDTVYLWISVIAQKFLQKNSYIDTVCTQQTTKVNKRYTNFSPHVKWSHYTNRKHTFPVIFRPSDFWNFCWIEVRRIIFLQHDFKQADFWMHLSRLLTPISWKFW